MAKRLPRGFHRQADDSIVCPHRDVTCCPTCVVNVHELRPMSGVVYFMTDEDVEAFIAEMVEYGSDAEELRTEMAADLERNAALAARLAK